MPWSVITGVGPELPGLGLAAAGIQHRRRGLVGKELGRGLQLLQQPLVDPRLVIQRPVTPAASTVDHLETPGLPLRVKHKVKSRHKPIFDPNTGPATSQIAITPENCPETPLTM